MLPPSTTFNVLVVDDDPSLRETIRASFATRTLHALEPQTGEAETAGQKLRELVLLDVASSGVSGVEMCRQIRALAPNAGMVVVSVRDADEAKEQRVRNAASDVLEAGGLKLEREHHIVWKNGRQIQLSPKESDLLACLMRNPGVPLSHVMLLRAVWGYEFGSEIEYLTSYIRTLRKKIEHDPARPDYILTEDWVGYRFRELSDASSSPSRPEHRENWNAVP